MENLTLIFELYEVVFKEDDGGKSVDYLLALNFKDAVFLAAEIADEYELILSSIDKLASGIHVSQFAKDKFCEGGK